MKKIFTIIYTTLIRLFIQPLIFLIPKNKNIVFIGYKDSYMGNARYLYEYMKNNGDNVYFITNSQKIHKKYNDSHGVLYLKSFRSVWLLITCSVVVSDTNTINIINLLTFRAKKVQLWHGNGMKTIGLLNFKKNKFWSQLRLGITRYMGSQVVYDLVYFTSDFAFQSRKEAFKYKKIGINGQPRNDILFQNSNYKLFDKKEKINTFNGVITYFPTWRKYNPGLNFSENVNFDKIIDFCERYNLLLIVKFHPMDKTNFGDSSLGKHFIRLDNNVDIYEVLKLSDVLITDYSSVYFDYLLLDKPIIFFPYDKDEYLKNEPIVYDYDDITPGKKVYNTNQLIEEINELLINKNDNFKEDRANVRNLFYKYQDNKSRERAAYDILELLNQRKRKK